MGDNLHRFPEDIREESGFRTGIVDGPGYAASGARQANISLRAYPAAQQERRGSHRRCNGFGCRWARDRAAKLAFFPIVSATLLGVDNSGNGQHCQRHCHCSTNDASGCAAQELLTEIVVHFFLLLPLT